ncbi:Exo-beta-1,3-glucanase [Tolypocladium paradoxum]|uniref:Exo-beta-1,3-glucanase n=1 Tax=Tolypocladium paradoxum TaxID=94208 RepID=A0A2S4L0D2_9HYPO|nr:Exo-beta-1,3-glucanase [Tolypocladium paradoxum]
MGSDSSTEITTFDITPCYILHLSSTSAPEAIDIHSLGKMYSIIAWPLLFLQCLALGHSSVDNVGKDNYPFRKDESAVPVGARLSSISSPSLADPMLRHQVKQTQTDSVEGERTEKDSSDLPKPARLAGSTVANVDKAREVVESAIRQAAQRNKERLANPMRNNYVLRPRTNTGSARVAEAPVEVESEPLFNVTAEIAAAAALVAEADAYDEMTTNSTIRRRYLEERSKRLEARRLNKRNRPSDFWLAKISHHGSWPFGENKDDFPVFRDVTDPKYGAFGDGVHDDTEAIRKAVTDGNMCGPGCYSSTTKGAIIFFPPGTYLVSGTIETYYGTQFIGDPKNRPVIKAAPSFVGLGVISTNRYVENGGSGTDGLAKQWFINTANFYRQIRNFVIDIRNTDPNAYVAALHYQVAQATSLQFIEFFAKTGTTQQAIFAENGSGGFISDLVFNGGNFGLYGGAQQFTVQRIQFNGCKTAVQLIWDWGWTWQGVYIKDAEVGFKLLSEDGKHNTGSLLVVDSVFENVGKAIVIFPAKAEVSDGTTGLTLDNIKVYLEANENVDTFVLGRIYLDQKKLDTLSDKYKSPRDRSLTGDNKWGLPQAPYFDRAKPQYEETSGDKFHHIKGSCKGDGVSDDTICIRDALSNYGSNSVIYFDAGSYMISDTIIIPNGAKIVGENWAQLVAFGDKFKDERNPRPLIKVGEKSQRGTVEMQDLIFTSKGPTAGVIFVEWNILSDGPGKAGMWDCHVRVGGARGTELTAKECPAGKFNEKCKAGSALMHVTPHASGYFDNVWLWVADHDIDDPSWENDNNFMEQCSIYVARGLLIESTEPTFLYGTSSEHSVFYQYEFYNAKNVLASMIQTESPYYQPNPRMPAPFEHIVGDMPGDPAYKCDKNETCDSSWALRLINSSDIMIHVKAVGRQTSLIDLQGNFGGVKIHNLITIGAVYMIESDGMKVKSSDNKAVDFHPRWSQIAVFDPKQFTNPCTGMPDNSNPQLPTGSYLPDRFKDEPKFVDLTIYEKNPGISNNDSAGEAYYQLRGTNKKWHVAARWNEKKSPEERVGISYTDLETNGTPKGALWDLGWPTHDDGVVVQWVLTGSEKYGYYDSANPPVAGCRPSLM